MKIPLLALTAITAAFLSASVLADDQAGGGKCEMMKKDDSASSTEQAELKKLVTEMNGNIGEKKLEAMAAILNRLVEQANAKAATPAPNPATDGDATKGDAHHH
jgi:hypothetical protein